MTPDKLKQLETLLNESDDFSVILTFFFDHFADHRLFIDKSKKIKVPLVKQMIKEASEVVFRKIPIVVTGLMMLDNERLSILHGSGKVEGHLFNFFYCKRINKGMLAISVKGFTEMVRITPKSVDQTNLTADFIESVDDFTVHYNNKNPN